ncbi:XRE family transcriptional regulator [Fulvivirgaceae bacterium PWU4]|uniref:XRE family transcriptional regulator n=1 Tax=Chryseosolibacter histidini TaxID=2782349 RepID=A0AAP2DRN2_9BACT|nr:helix-turn-helix transcriptional regulator [Chryseosolibacter histidini]MBT1699119.1 XRE family transcriptional regulator [Chryseosolibacter histidini]
MAATKLTALGGLFVKRSVNKASISRRTGITKQRLTRLSRETNIRILASEVYLIAITIGMDPGKLLDLLCKHLKSRVKADTRADGRKNKKKKRKKKS